MAVAPEALISSMTAIEPPRVLTQPPSVDRALEELHAECWGWALACCGRDRELAEDVLQTAYLRVLSGAARFDGGSSFKTWVFGVIRMIARAEKRRTWLWGSRHRHTDAALAVPDATARVDASVENADRAAVLVRAMRRLSSRQREILQLVFYHDLTVEEAASVMGVSVGSARTHYDRGKKSLARLLGDEDPR
jgi:RNA polymerase sigma factor (sigma-70 family)